MLRHSINHRPNWQNRVADCGVDPGDVPTCWHEGHCYEITPQQANVLHHLTEQLYQLMVEATDRMIDDGSIFDFWDDPSQAAAIVRSWNDADYHPTLLSRFDFVWRGSDQFQLTSMNLFSRELLLESAVAQWHWLTERIPWATQYNHIQERLISMWRDYRYPGKTVHFTFPEESYETYLVAEYLEDLAREAGVNTRLLSSAAFRFEQSEQLFFDDLNLPVQRLILGGSESHLGSISLARAYEIDSLCLVEPLWKRLWAHPQWFNQLRRTFPDDPRIGLIRHSSLHLPAVICSSWIVAGEVCGIGICEVLHARKRRFIPHLLDTMAQTRPSVDPPSSVPDVTKAS